MFRTFVLIGLTLAFTVAQAQQGSMNMPMPATKAAATSKWPAAPVTISGAFVQALPPGTTDGSAYLNITNTGNTALKLTGGISDVSQMVMPMEQTKMTGMAGMTGMKDLPFMLIAPGQTLTLKPGGDHLMLYRLKRVPQVGEMVSLTLNFSGYAPLTLKVPVRRL